MTLLLFPRCMITKHVQPDEVGKLLSVVGAFQAFIPIISSPIFGLIYRSTVETLPQTFLIVLAALFFIDWVILFAINRGIHGIDLKKDEVEAQMKEVKLAEEMKRLSTAST